MKKHIRIGKYKTVFKGLTFTIKRAKAIMPSGEVKIYERALRPPSVNILAVDKKKRLLLINEYRPYQKKYLWGLPSGKVDKGEMPKHAAQRELMEEAGFKAKKLRLFYKTEPAASYEYINYIYLATDLEKHKLPYDEGEEITVIPTPLTKAYKMVIDGKLLGKQTAMSICKLYWGRKKYLK